MTKRVYKTTLVTKNPTYFKRQSISIGEKEILSCRQLFNENKNLLLKIKVFNNNKTKSYNKEIKAKIFLAGLVSRTSWDRKRYFSYKFN